MLPKHQILLILITVATFTFIIWRPELNINNRNESCKNPTKFEDYTDKDKRLLICEDSVNYGDDQVTTKHKTPGIFEYKFNDQDPWEPTHEVVTYKIDSTEYIAVFPVINPQSWYRRSGYIFQKTDNEYKLIFSRDFESLSGRWTGVRFDENSSVFDPSTIVVNQDFGALGLDGQRIRWTDYYVWNNQKETYELANNKMAYRMKEIVKAYEELDLTACGNESPEMEGNSISDLYQTRKDNDHFCDDDSPVPYISNKQAEMFLKAKTALTEISKGENISFQEVENVRVN